MKLRLLIPTIPDFSLFNSILTDIPSYTQAKGEYAGFTNGDDTICASGEKKPLFINTDSIFSFYLELLQYTSQMIAGKPVNAHYIVKLKV
ncbi:MAG: hypothetical protein ABIN67_24735 [Ferruginibacter sp.]